MKKGIFTIGFLAMLLFFNPLVAQEDNSNEDTSNIETTEQIMESDTSSEMEELVEAEPEVEATAIEEVIEVQEEVVEEDTSVSQALKLKFIEGGPLFMSFVLIALILGLALSIERIIYLNLATTNTKKLLSDIESALSNGGVDAAKEVCRNTRGPVASIFLQGLERSSEGVEMVEKSVIAYGGVQMGLLERGLSWIGLFIALAPMLGFMGTVIGMIQAFDIIELKGEAKPDELAGGIKVALITTVSGLIVAIILQVFYNYIVSKIDSLVNQMEDASISLIDVLVKHKLSK
jgi:biopolymer transport protein ExbB